MSKRSKPPKIIVCHQKWYMHSRHAGVAGYLTFSFWKTVFQQLGVVRNRAQITSSTNTYQALPTSSQHVYSGPDLPGKSQASGASSASASSNSQPNQSGADQSRAPMQALSEAAPGETTRQATHNRLTTEPAKDPLNKDISTYLPLLCHAISSYALGVCFDAKQSCCMHTVCLVSGDGARLRFVPEISWLLCSALMMLGDCAAGLSCYSYKSCA